VINDIKEKRRDKIKKLEAKITSKKRKKKAEHSSDLAHMTPAATNSLVSVNTKQTYSRKVQAKQKPIRSYFNSN